jgi:predicted flap endonuclease-1-like 5' DNA nuclease
MKRILRLLTVAGAVAGAVWYTRQQREHQPVSSPGKPAPGPTLQAVPDPGPPRADPPAATDDLTEIKGIGPKYAQQLADLGMTSFAALAAADPEQLSSDFEARAQVDDWITQAKDRS